MQLKGRITGRVKILSSTSLAMAVFALSAPLASASSGTITQVAPMTGSVTVANSATFTDQLAVTGAAGTVTYAAPNPSNPVGLDVSAMGVVSTTSALAGGTYSISGTDSDTGDVDSGTWTYALTVGDISQISPFAGAATVANSANFTDQLNVNGANGSVTFVSNPSSPAGLEVTSIGAVSVPAKLAAGTYTISGTDSDPNGDSGSWSYSLTVSAVTLTQTSPNSGSTTTKASATFNPGALSVSGSSGTVAFVETTTSNGLSLANGQISTTGALSAGSYTIAGTDSDSFGDSGNWTYTLTVAPVGGSTITQTSPTSATTTVQDAGAYNPGSLAVTNNVGAVTFVTAHPNPDLQVSSAGVITTLGTLDIGTYTVAGTDSDAHGDTGTWTFTLAVTGVVSTVTFEDNGGVGTMSPESASVPTALHLNSLTRTGYSFVDWNTAANGSGVSYANGSTYPFGQSTKLYAQWKAGRAPARTVVFAANGGLGSMTPETANTPTALVSNRFTRNGYSFSGWNSSPAGSGTSYVAGAIYPFKVSVTLYAQWKKIPKPPTFTVTFLANGGTGAMRKERHRTPEALEHVAFKRIGFTFINWNTAPAGSGIAYPAGSIYSFVKSITLYAQWQRLKIVVPPAVDAELTVGPFTAKSSALTVAIEGEVGRLALEVKKDHDSKVALVGFGDRLSAANELNEALWAKNALLSQKRAQAVETYLRHSLAELGIVKIKITRSADTAKAGADGAKSEVGVVTAALT